MKKVSVELMKNLFAPVVLAKVYSLSAEGKLYKSGILVTQRKGNRLLTRHLGVEYDAAAVAFGIHYGFFPIRRLTFVDRSPDNLAISNLSLSLRYPSREKMRLEHERMLQLSATMLDRMAKDKVKPPDPREGYMFYTYKGEKLEIPEPAGPWDDVVVRCQKVLAERASA